MPQSLVSRLVLPGLGIAAVVILWALVSQTVAPDLPSPVKTWSESRRYVLGEGDFGFAFDGIVPVELPHKPHGLLVG